jgi:hypothetical protein
MPNVYMPWVSGSENPNTPWTPQQPVAPQSQGWTTPVASGGQDFTGYQQRQLELDALIAAAQAQYDRLRESGVNERFAKEQALSWAQFEWTKKIQQEQLGLDTMKTLASLKGPRDWLTYNRVWSGLQGSNMPAYGQQLLSNSALPSFRGLDFQALFKNSFNPVFNAIDQAQQPGGGQTLPTPQQTVGGGGGVEQVNMPNIQPHQISQRAWNSMAPSAQQMLAGQMEAAGIDWGDYMNQMTKAWNTRKVTPITQWR